MNTANNEFQSDHSDEINLREIFFAIVEKKLFIFFFTSLFALSSIIYSLVVPKIWVSDSLLSLTQSPNSSNSSSSTLGGMASLAGLRMTSSSSGPDKAEIVLATIHSRDFFKHLISSQKTLMKRIILMNLILMFMILSNLLGLMTRLHFLNLMINTEIQCLLTTIHWDLAL